MPSNMFFGHDDSYDNFNTQSSSQWDGLSHFGHYKYGFYNGFQMKDITGKEGTKLGIEHMARKGISGRLVFIDFERWIREQERIQKEKGQVVEKPYAPEKCYGYTANQIREVAKAQGVSFQEGDFLCVRTGWIKWYESLNEQERTELSKTDPHHYSWAGIEIEEESLKFLWDEHFAAVISDCPSFEKFPPPEAKLENLLHNTILGLWGMPIGEMFDLEALSEDCARDKRYECFFVSAPLNKLGGVATPPNAMAIK